ncbi:VOC family protein [Robertmurraya sp. P23]|uniref:VOC family protein n=1 Tax=Robertmurraya sp. P23 TaxID=3436931 RepID=UPI003D99D411
MANLSWDHTVHYVRNLDAAVEIFTNKHLHAFRGGSHTTWGTYNALSYFGLCYLEFLAIEDAKLVEKNKNVNAVVHDAARLLPEKEVIARLAIRTDHIEETVHSLKEKGLKLSPIVEGSRINHLGKKIEWKMASVEGDFEGVVYPFFIHWKESDEERFRSLKDSGAIQPHRAGKVTLHEAIIYCDDPHKTASHWCEVFGLKMEETGKDFIKIRIQEQFFTFQKGSVDQSMKLVFHTDRVEVKGTTFFIGEGEYVFQ